MANLLLAKHGRGFLAADEDAEKFHKKLETGECILLKPIRVRDLKAHRRYWKLCTLCAENCERITLDDGSVFPIHNKDDVHTVIKLATGHYTSIFDTDGREAFRIPKSTSFADMTADEWQEYWPRVLDVVQSKVLPGVDIDSVQLEIMKCMGTAG